MAGIKKLEFFLLILVRLFISSSSMECLSYKFVNKEQFTYCIDLPYLNSFIHWDYNQSSRIMQMAYRQKEVSPAAWVAWGINPIGTKMVGTQALVAHADPYGVWKAYTSPITETLTKLDEGNLMFDVSKLDASYDGNHAIIFATLGLPRNSETLNQLWQTGHVDHGKPQGHDVKIPNLRLKAAINLLSGDIDHSKGNDRMEKANLSDIGQPRGNDRLKNAKIHGTLSAVSWGVMMPLGALIARYIRAFESEGKVGFYLHATCQCTAYVVGVAGVGTGLKLGNESVGVHYNTHRAIGIVVLVLGTRQVLALILRPKPDHKYRKYWSIYISIGYSVVLLSIINVFRGIRILNLDKKWTDAYINVIATLAVSAFWLEVDMWCVVRKKKKADDDAAKDTPNNDYRVRQQPAVLFI